MSDSLRIALEEELTLSRPEAARFDHAFKASRPALDERSRVLGATAQRLLPALSEWLGSGAGAQGQSDVVVLLRQLVRGLQPTRINSSHWEAMRTRAETAGLIGTPLDDGTVLVRAQPWRAIWLDHSGLIDQIARRDLPEESVGDGMLYAMSEAAGAPWTAYRSDAQKAAVDCWTFAAPGSTTLVTLPTGGGKSLCAFLPPWFETRGGRNPHGTTLVVVPTVALAFDQERQARHFFRESIGDLSKPISRTGDTLPEDRRAIETAVREGRLPIIFTSPESLLSSRLYDVCLGAARDGLITRFVIDEAHLVHTWGAGFRPEFQLLASYRHRLLSASQGKLRTLLLSATVGEQGRLTLEKLFSEPGKLVVIQANRLRPEIGYWFNISNNETTRRERVLEALAYLPRPLILYVTRPDQAGKWEEVLRQNGYSRIATFTGETNTELRRRLMRQWDGNQIDVVIATSAFGLGVDKGNVRSILHATLPENIDRFYQEVGRGGRDGYSSVSLMCAVFNRDRENNDIPLAYSLQPRLITYKRALPRWGAMINGSIREGDVRWVDRDVVPPGTDILPSELNRDWNDHLLLLMQRAGLITIADAPPPRERDGEWLARVPIRVLDPMVYNDPELAWNRIEQYREEEKESAKRARDRLIGLVKGYSSGKANHCLASEFAGVYDDVGHACGGCPWCRANGIEPYTSRLEMKVAFPTALRRAVSGEGQLDEVLRSRMGGWRALNVTWSGAQTMGALAVHVGLIPILVQAGVQQIIYPKELLDEATRRVQVLSALASSNPHKPPVLHRLVPDSWVVHEGYPLFPLATAVIYSPDARAADELFRSLERGRANGVVFPATVNVVHFSLYLASAGKFFLEHVDGLTEPIGRAQELLSASEQDIELF